MEIWGLIIFKKPEHPLLAIPTCYTIPLFRWQQLLKRSQKQQSENNVKIE